MLVKFGEKNSTPAPLPLSVFGQVLRYILSEAKICMSGSGSHSCTGIWAKERVPVPEQRKRLAEMEANKQLKLQYMLKAYEFFHKFLSHFKHQPLDMLKLNQIVWLLYPKCLHLTWILQDSSVGCFLISITCSSGTRAQSNWFIVISVFQC